MAPTIVDHPNTIRGPIESEYNGLRDAREKEYVAARVALEAEYHSDLADIQSDKEAALVNAGLNPDGGVPTTYGHHPENVEDPSITGTTTVGEELTADPGTWNPDSAALTYQWQRAAANGSGLADIEGATAATYTLVGDDSGKKVRVKVTGTSAGGGEVATSPYTGLVAAE